MALYEQLPARRYERRVVIVVDLPGMYALRDNTDASALASREDVAVIYAGTDLDLTDEVTRSLERQGMLVPGAVLVASPYRDGDYAALEEAADRFGLQKWAAISTLCGYLGARTVDVKVVEDTLSDTRIELKAGGGRGPVAADASGKSDHVVKFAGQLHWHDEFAGGQMDLDLAKEHLRDSGLEADPEVRSLLEARSNNGNVLQKRTVTVDLSRESERTIEAALSVKVPAVLKLDAAFKRAATSRAHYKVQFEVDFAQ